MHEILVATKLVVENLSYLGLIPMKLIPIADTMVLWKSQKAEHLASLPKRGSFECFRI